MSREPEPQVVGHAVQEFIDGSLKDGDEVLLLLQEHNNRLRAQVPTNPQAALRANVFPQAFELVRHAVRLAQEFARRQDTMREEKALHLRTGPVCWVHGHHRHLVGPAMLDWAECNERLGNQEKAAMIYDAVVKDFVEILDWDQNDKGYKIALESLKKALEKSPQAAPALLEKTNRKLAVTFDKPSEN